MKIFKSLSTLIPVFSCFLFSMACTQKTGNMLRKDTPRAAIEPLYEENFEDGLENWRVEQMPGGKVVVKDGKLDIDDAEGCTVWFNKLLEEPLIIQYDAVVIENGGIHDRVSDLNCFWMARDNENPGNLFEKSIWRGGKFSRYDSLRLYYMGVGGNDNSSTRFRRYPGNGSRPLLKEHDLSARKFLLKPNKLYRIKIIVTGGVIQFYLNNIKLIDFFDENPYASGYFGLRTVNNHLTIDNFKVYRAAGTE